MLDIFKEKQGSCIIQYKDIFVSFHLVLKTKNEIFPSSNFTHRLLGFHFDREVPVVPGQIKKLTLFHGGCAASQQEGGGPGGTRRFDQESCENDCKVPSARSNKLVTHAALHSKASNVVSAKDVHYSCATKL